MSSESEFTAWFVKQLKDRGFQVLVFAGGNPYQQAGLPDRYIFGPGIPGLWLEFKATTSLSPAQKVLYKHFARWNVPSLVVRYTELQGRDVVSVEEGEVPVRFEILRRSKLGSELVAYLRRALGEPI